MSQTPNEKLQAVGIKNEVTVDIIRDRVLISLNLCGLAQCLAQPLIYDRFL